MKIIDYSIIENNIKEILKTNKLMLVLKNDSYNLDTNKILNLGLKYNIKDYAVNKIEEALTLRSLNKDINILLISPYFGNLDIILENKIILSISSYIEFNRYNMVNIKMHIKIDSGLNRFGFKQIPYNLLSKDNVIGFYTHINQIDNNSINMIKKLEQLSLKYHKLLHLGGSIVYGYTNYTLRALKIICKDAISLYGKIIGFKQINKNESIGYNKDYTVSKNTYVAIVDIGYYNGIPKDYSYYVYKDGYRKIYSVFMNHLVIDAKVSDNLLDVVEVFGKNISFEEFLLHSKTQEYVELLKIM